MTKRDPESEKSAVNYMTHAMLSVSLLLALEEKYSANRDMTIGQFYESFNTTHQSRRFRPFNEGIVLAFLYWLVFAKENWPDLVPDSDLSAWSITPLRVVIPKKPNPKLKYLIRRIRNALGHGTPKITFPLGTTVADMATQVTITFFDVKPKDKADTFEVELSLKDAFHLAKMLHKTVHDDVASRHGVIPPAVVAP